MTPETTATATETGYALIEKLRRYVDFDDEEVGALTRLLMRTRGPEAKLSPREPFLKIEGHVSLHLVQRAMKHNREGFVKPQATMIRPAG